MEPISDWQKLLDEAIDKLRKENAINRPLPLREQLKTALNSILELPKAKAVFGNELTDNWGAITSTVPGHVTAFLRDNFKADGGQYFLLGSDSTAEGLLAVFYHKNNEECSIAICPLARCNWRQASGGEYFSDLKPIDGVQNERFSVTGNDPEEIKEMVRKASIHILSAVAGLQINREAQNELKETLPRP